MLIKVGVLMKKKTIIIIMSLIIISLSSIYAYSLQNKVSNNTRPSEQQCRNDFDSSNLKSNFSNRDEVIAEITRLSKSFKMDLGYHRNDDYGKEIINKYETMMQQLNSELDKFPKPPLDLDSVIEEKYIFFKDNVARLGSDAPNGTRDDYQYELDEAQSIYDQYKNKTITTQQAYGRIIKIKYTDRQNGIKN